MQPFLFIEQSDTCRLVSLLCFALLFTARASTASDQGPVAQKPAGAVGAKVVFFDDRQRILLVFDEARQAWEIPGTAPEGTVTVRELVDGMAGEFGLSFDRLELRGLFTYHNPQTSRTILRPYFAARFRTFIDGHGFRPGQRLQWFALDDALSAIPYPASRLILKKIMREPRDVWGAAFEEYGYASPMTPETRVTFRIVEDFYKLH